MKPPRSTSIAGSCARGVWLGLVLVGAGSEALAQSGAIPVYCKASADVGAEAPFSCRRADTRAEFPAVPTGHFLQITDVLAGRSDPAASGTFGVVVGRDREDSPPSQPHIDLTGTPEALARRHLTTPLIVLSEGETLVAANLASSDFAIDVRVTGFLAETVAVPEPDSPLLVWAALASLAALASRRARVDCIPGKGASRMSRSSTISLRARPVSTERTLATS